MDFFHEVSRVLQGGSLAPGMNSTLITLILKVSGPTSMAQFVPINLYQVMYKIIIKVITNKLKLVLPHLIGPTQTSFVPGRQIYENIVFNSKVISKTLVNRLKPWMHLLIHDDQNAFIPDQAIQDNIVIAHEVFHYLKTSSSLLHSMGLKLDMYKAYNHVDWGFLYLVLYCEFFYSS